MHAVLKDRIQKIDGLVARIRAGADPQLRDAALDLVQTVMEFHSAGIDRMMEIASESGDTGWRIIEDFGRDELVANMLLLHGLHPVDLEARVREALQKVLPYLHSHGGNVELIEVAGGVVRLRLIGSCNGCPSSSLTLKTAIEKAIFEAAPDVTSVECEGVSELVSIHNAA
jgi:Fe-S cluster biogenesis protein NfuA